MFKKKKQNKGVLRKLTHKNPNPEERALYFEVGRLAAPSIDKSWKISAIRKMEEIIANQLTSFHRIYITKETEHGTEEMVWKDVYKDYVEEYDVT